MIIRFDNIDKTIWLKKIVQIVDDAKNYSKGKTIVLDFSQSIQKDNLSPIHIVTYACLIHYLKFVRGCEVTQGQSNKDVANFIYDELGLKYYYKGTNHIESTDTSILNLWRVIREEADLYTKRVAEYFENNYFRNKDLSSVSISMVEAFYNISDHAQAGENAFSLIMYNHQRNELKVAISDWGKGIVGTVREFDKSINSDKEALERAIQDDFTISSTTHNKGKGLSNILSCSDVVRIFSGNALLLKNSDQLKIFEVGFYYPGTLIYFDKDLDKLEDIDYLDDFNW